MYIHFVFPKNWSSSLWDTTQHTSFGAKKSKSAKRSFILRKRPRNQNPVEGIPDRLVPGSGENKRTPSVFNKNCTLECTLGPGRPKVNP